MMVVYEVPALAEQIRNNYGPVQIIGIDGFTEAGKTAPPRPEQSAF